MGNSHKMLVSANVKVFDVNNNIKHDLHLHPSNTNDWMIGIKTDDITHEQPMKSFNRNWLQFFYKSIQSRSMNYIWSYTGGRSNGAVAFTNVVGNAGANDGICLGTGSLTPSFYLYDLKYEIPHAILIRGGTTWVVPYVSGSTYEFGLYRTFVATKDFTITEMKLCSDTTSRYMWTYENIDVSGSAINVSLPSGSTATAWVRFNIDEGGPLTKNFLYAFYSHIRNISVTLTSTTSASTANNWYLNPQTDWNLTNASTDVYGIVIGTNTSSFSVEDYQLYDKITSGTGSGQLTYLSTTFDEVYATDVTLVTLDSQSCSHTIYRTFLNESGGPVTLGECGIYCQGSATTTEDNSKFMFARNPFPAHLTLNDREAISVGYTFEYTA